MFVISLTNIYWFDLLINIRMFYKASPICVVLVCIFKYAACLVYLVYLGYGSLSSLFLLIKPNPFLESLEDINPSWKKGIDFSVWNGHLKYRLECYRIRLNKGFMSSHQDAQRRNLFNIVVALNFWMDKPNTVGRRSTYLLSVFDIPSIKNLQA